MKSEQERQEDLQDIKDHEDRFEKDMKSKIWAARELNFWWADKEISFANALGKNILHDELEFPEHARATYGGLSEETKNRLIAGSRQDIAMIYGLCVSTIKEVRSTKVLLRFVFGLTALSMILNGWLLYELIL